MNMAIICAHYGADSLSQAVLSWGSDVPLFIVDGSKGMLPAYQRGYAGSDENFRWNGESWSSNGYKILAYLHDDLLVNDPTWPTRVLSQFVDPKVAVVGFGGARGSGTPNIYKVPYEYKQLARQGFMSNMVDAEAHGERFTGDRDVAVLDGFALIIRRSFLDEIGGWPVGTDIGYINYDLWLCLMARRRGYKVRLCGIPCQHLGGRTFVKMKVGEKEDHWGKYLKAHEYIYSEFKDCLPFTVGVR